MPTKQVFTQDMRYRKGNGLEVVKTIFEMDKDLRVHFEKRKIKEGKTFRFLFNSILRKYKNEF